MKEALTTSVLNDGILGEYGFGWETKKSPDEIYHTGLEHGSRTLFITFPKKELTIILLANFNELKGKQIRDLTKMIYKIVIGENLD